MSAVSLALGALALAACAPTARLAAPAPETHGRFEFSESVPGSSRPIVLQGEFEVTPDSVLLQEVRDYGRCDLIQPPEIGHIRYQCGEVEVTFDRRRPLLVALYRIEGYRLSPRTQCVGARVVTQGEVVCARPAVDEVETVATFTGRLHARPVRSAQR